MKFNNNDAAAEIATRFLEKTNERIKQRNEIELTPGQYNSVFEELYEFAKRLLSDE